MARRNLPNLVLGDDVEADGRLVQEKQRRIVQAAPRPDRNACARRVKACAPACTDNPDAEDLIEFFHALAEVALGNFVNAAQKLEGFDDGDVPPELRALAENDADGLHVLAALFIWNETVDSGFAGSRASECR